jgi:hypothetical protein
MCVHCGHPHISDRFGFCLACSIEIRREFYAGLERLTAYLASWAAFEEWEAEHPGGLDETSSVPPEARRSPVDTRAPCVLASERPSRPGDERRSAKPS